MLYIVFSEAKYTAATSSSMSMVGGVGADEAGWLGLSRES